MSGTGARDELVGLLREQAAEAERLGRAFAERHGMHPTDLSALLAVMLAEQEGTPLTPGRLGAQLGLSSGATTAVIDRLERADYVRRDRDQRDRRRVALHMAGTAVALGTAFFGPLGKRIDAVLAGYTPAQLATVRRFLAETNAAMGRYRREMGGAGDPDAGLVAARAPLAAAAEGTEPVG